MTSRAVDDHQEAQKSDHSAGEAIAEILDGTLPREQWHSPFWKLRHIFVNAAAVRFFNWVMSVPRTVS